MEIDETGLICGRLWRENQRLADRLFMGKDELSFKGAETFFGREEIFISIISRLGSGIEPGFC